MLAGITDDLCRCVEAHRLGVEKCCATHVRMMAFPPGRGIGDQREAGGVALGKAVASKSFALLESLLVELALLAAAHSPIHQLFAKLGPPTSHLPPPHCPPDPTT